MLVLRSGKEHRSHSEFLLTRNSVGQDTKNRIQQTQVLHSPFFTRHDIIVCSCSDNIRAICCRMYVCVCVCLGIMYVNIYLILKFYTLSLCTCNENMSNKKVCTYRFVYEIDVHCCQLKLVQLGVKLEHQVHPDNKYSTHKNYFSESKNTWNVYNIHIGKIWLSCVHISM